MARPTRRQIARVVRHPALRSPRVAAQIARRQLDARPVTAAHRARAWAPRLRVLAETLGRPLPPGPPVSGLAPALRPMLAAIVKYTEPDEVWLALAVLSGQLPTEETVLEVTRRGEFDTGLALAQAIARATTAASADVDVVVSNGVLVDVDHTVGVSFTSGIQRVVRETVGRWLADGRGDPVGWVPGHTALRWLTSSERGTIAQTPPIPEPTGSRTVAGPARAVRPMTETVVVPWGGAYLLPELALELPRLSRVRALARFARVQTGAIGYDCVPITSAETVALGIGSFARYLAALKHVDRIATISQAAADEFSGWVGMLAATGLTGPEVTPILLPAEVPPASEETLAAASERFGTGDRPLVLVVGSHEPRKNHLAVLHAAELLWRRGLDFSLAFVGGRGWDSEVFIEQVDRLQQRGRPISMPTGVDDRMLFAAYRLARYTVFPSLNEGFGLPVAESLACGTPAITSRFGSMLEIASGGGALVVDPRDDHDLAEAMARLLVDDTEVDRLGHEAAARRDRTWDEYAALVWDCLVGKAVND